MKKLLSLLLILILALALCSCGGGDDEPKPSPGPSPEPDPAPADTGLSSYELWEKLKGIWICTGSRLDFAEFTTEGPELYLTQGILFSDGVESGSVSGFSYNDGTYTFTSNVPERPADDISGGWSAHSYSIVLQLTDDENVIKLTNAFTGDGKVVEYRRIADNWEALDMDELLYGPEIDPADAWKRLSGVWLAKDVNAKDKRVYFLFFETRNGTDHFYFTGIPFSGSAFAVEPETVRYDDQTDTYMIRLEYEGSRRDVFVDCGGESGDPRTIETDVIFGSGSVGTWTYCCESLADEDALWDMLDEMEG